MIFRIFKQKGIFAVLNVNQHLNVAITVGNSIKSTMIIYTFILSIIFTKRSDYNGGTCWVRFFFLMKLFN